jgi:hypothetical protein
VQTLLSDILTITKKERIILICTIIKSCSKERIQTVVVKKMMLRKIFVTRIELDELNVGWRRLNGDKLRCSFNERKDMELVHNWAQ